MKVGLTKQSGKLILVEGRKEGINLKVGDGDGLNLCSVKKKGDVSSTFIENIFRTGSGRLKTNKMTKFEFGVFLFNLI